MSVRPIKAVVALTAIFLCYPATAQAQSRNLTSQPYTWRNVQIVGGGFVDGIIFHPKEKGLRYARTDIGGAYRWNDQSKRWEPLLDWVSYPDMNLMGVESIAVDPSDPDRVYFACGTYTNPHTPNGAILRSRDRGRTFQRTNVPFKFGGNETGRGNGERLAVDPNDGNILYLGTRHDNLWKSADAGATWNRVISFPDVTEAPTAPTPGENPWVAAQTRGAGIVFVIFDPSSGAKAKPSSTIYAGVSLLGRDNVFRSTDAGKTWLPIPREPTQYRPHRAALASDGNLYIAYGTVPGPWRMPDGAVWKFNTKSGEWADVTPEKPNAEGFGWAAVSVDARNPQVLIASSFDRHVGGKGDHDDIYRSTDGGGTWKPVLSSGATFDASLAPYVSDTPIHWMFDIEIDPFDSDHAMFTTGYGGWETFDLSDVDRGKPTTWSVMSTGIEETVALDLLSPPQGAHLISAIGDYGGFVHWDLDKPSPAHSSQPPLFGNTTSVACAESKPEVVVRVGRASGHHPGLNIGYSVDGGKTWQPPASMPQPDSALGNIAVSSDASTWVWTPERSPVYLTRDRGATWTESKGVPADSRIIADRVNPQKFYGLDLFGGKLFLSTDGAATFLAQPLRLPNGLPKKATETHPRGDDRGGQDRIYATLGREGDLWLAAFDGLYHSADAGKTFTRFPDVQEIHAFGFGKAAPNQTSPALYLVGIVRGTRGIFRSDNSARTWVRINDDQHQWGLILHITGDPKDYGRVYVGTHGRGIVYGDPATR